MTRQKSLSTMIQESFAAESSMSRFRAMLSDDEKRTLEQVLGAGGACRPFLESVSEFSSIESLLLYTTLRQSQKIERLEILLQRLTVRVLELYASQERIPEQTP